MVLIPLLCPRCKSDDVVKNGNSKNEKQRYLCQNNVCNIKTFITDYEYRGCIADIKDRILDMTMNASGIRDIARVLEIDKNTVLRKLKETTLTDRVNKPLLEGIDSCNVIVEIQLVDEAELDEMWSFVGSKENQRWLWWAIDHNTGDVSAFTFGKRKDKVFKELQAMLKPFGIGHSDDWGAYTRNINPTDLTIGKDKTWRIERKHLTLRTRIKRLTRWTICFSKSIFMHDLVIGMFINYFEFGAALA